MVKIKINFFFFWRDPARCVFVFPSRTDLSVINYIYFTPYPFIFSSNLYYLVITEQLHSPINYPIHCVDGLVIVISGYSTASAFVTCGISTVLTVLRYNLSCLKVGEGGRGGGLIAGVCRGPSGSCCLF
jgi:hypothetical protein